MPDSVDPTGEAVVRPHSGGPSPSENPARRSALTWLSSLGLIAALAAAYGTFAAFLARFVYPARPPAKGWMYVTRASRLESGTSLLYRTPAGATVTLARKKVDAGTFSESTDDAFIALSSTCPHLGCQVHWQPVHDRFFCPCHNGIFDPQGTAISGPPAEAGQSLPRYALKVEDDLLYIEVPMDELAMGPGEILEPPPMCPGPGHDPCLQPPTLRPRVEEA